MESASKPDPSNPSADRRRVWKDDAESAPGGNGWFREQHRLREGEKPKGGNAKMPKQDLTLGL